MAKGRDLQAQGSALPSLAASKKSVDEAKAAYDASLAELQRVVVRCAGNGRMLRKARQTFDDCLARDLDRALADMRAVQI